jgi:hypothetical protein
MKSFKNFALIIVSGAYAGQAHAQVPFTNYLCAADTSFKGLKNYSSTVKSNSIGFSVNGDAQVDGSLTGEISGLGFNRNTSFTNYQGKGTVKTFESGFLYSLHNYNNGNTLSSINKNTISLSVLDKPLISNTEAVPYATNIAPRPTRLQKMNTGESSFSSSNSRGNLFISTRYFRSNKELFVLNNDTFPNTNDKGIVTAQFEGQKTNFKQLLSKMSSAEYEGWILELDRINNNIQYRRFDLGRAPRSAFKIISERVNETTSSIITESYQVLGDEFNILLKTTENNKIHEFYVYSEIENSLESHWTLLNKEVSGKLETLNREYLIDLYQSILRDTTLEYTIFHKIKDLHYNRANQNIILISQGGSSDYNKFLQDNGLSKVIDLKISYSSNLKEFESGGIINDPYGSIIEIKGIDDLPLFTKCNFDLGKGRKFTNPVSINLTNVQYEDENFLPKNSSYFVFTEGVFSNKQGQNPGNKKGENDFQNEIYLADLSLTDESDVSIDFSKLDYRLVGVTAGGEEISIPKYSEAYMPIVMVNKSLNLSADTISVLKGFAEQFINPILCEESNSTEVIQDVIVDVIVYPNPISKGISAESVLKCNIKDNLRLYDFVGNLVLESLDTNELDISKCQSGLFIIKGDKGWSRKVVIQ